MENQKNGTSMQVDEDQIPEILTSLTKKRRLEHHLPGGGYLHMSDELPYLVIIRRPASEEEQQHGETLNRFVLSEASFLIIGDSNFEIYQQLILALGEAMATKFKSFLLLELYEGQPDSCQFVIKGPAEKLPATLKSLKKELDTLPEQYLALSLKPALIKDTVARQPAGAPPLLEVDTLKDAGILLVGMEIPPVYKSAEGVLYPVFFRKFRDEIVRVLHKGIFEFIRVQTTSGVSSYHALGQKSIKEKALEIDHALAKIEKSYQFLWLISPSNIRHIKDTFFESNYEEVLTYHYRLLPIDPDVLKRELYNLKIEEIDDPALSFLFREKREELEMQISMLSDRGTIDFFYNSLMLYHGVDEPLEAEARQLLKDITEEPPREAESLLNAWDFKALAEKEFEYFRGQDENFSSKIHVRDDVNIMMVSQGELYIPSDYKSDATDSEALIQHEVGTHVLTYYNGLQQPLKQLSTGLPGYDTLQEGLAVMAEYLVGSLSGNRMRTLAGRVIASAARVDGGDFRSIFELLRHEYGFSDLPAFNITSRIMQGSGFIKDIIYFQGIIELKKYLEEGGELEPLLIGKFALKHLPVINELTERKVLRDNTLLPRYLHLESTKKKLTRIRNGISISQMINV